MKTLFIVRHAKSSWKDQGVSDFERPLNKRGERDAPFMAKLIAQKNEKPELIITSPAVRALTTAKYFAESLSIEKQNFLTDQDVYDAGIGNMMKIINNIPNHYNSSMIFGHNPTLTALVNYLGDKYIDNLPTCAVVKITFDVDNWSDVNDASGRIGFFEYPGKYFKD